MPNPDRYTCRCTICGINWPWLQAFKTCPLCSHETASSELHNDDEILDAKQAAEVIKRYRKAEKVEAEALAKAQREWEEKQEAWIEYCLEQDIAELHADLDAWAAS